MNKANLKSYAPQARKDFIAAVTARANQLGLSAKAGSLEVAPAQTQGDVTVIAGQAWPSKISGQRDQLIERIRKDGFEHTMDAVAYTWFNRFAALRYMELHDYLGHGHRALSSTAGGLPDMLTHATDLSNDLPGLSAAKVTELKLAGNRDGELYRMLLVAQCNALSRAMPFLFERIDDDSELLLPDNLLRSDSVIAKLVEEIPEEDWAEVEIIGWLYQFYISERKDQVIGKMVKSEDIPAATQLFTPNWIVQYMVQNSVGRLWLMANPQSTLASEWPYYITPAAQTPEVQAQLDSLIQTRVREDGDTLNPESITVLDPACGSGHILVVAYDVLKAIYLERGYLPRAIPRLILEKNLYGLDIDDRAAQMAGFALLMKARADDRRLFTTTDDAGNLQPPKLNVLSLQESKDLGVDELATHLAPFNVQRATINALVSTFEHAKTFGSLIQIPYALKTHLAVLPQVLALVKQSGDMYARGAADDLLPLVQQAQMLALQFDAVVANPPYMGGKYLNSQLKVYLKENFEGFEKDLFSAFMVRNLLLTKSTGQLGFMSPFVWMFISSYEQLRHHFIDCATLTSLIQLEYSGFDGATVPICTFTLNKQHTENFLGSYVRLSDFRGADQQGQKTLEALHTPNCSWLHKAKADNFKKIPGSPIVYWFSENIYKLFSVNNKLSELCEIRAGLQTGDNDKFLRYWHEVSIDKVGLKIETRQQSIDSTKTWFPHNKGGGFRKWYGNSEYLINWFNDGNLIKTKKISDLKSGKITPNNSKCWNQDYYFLEGLTWSSLTSGAPSIRANGPGYLFDTKGQTLFPNNILDSKFIHGFLNSKVASVLLMALSPTLDFNGGVFAKLPVVNTSEKVKIKINQLVTIAVNASKLDWDSLEQSWDFKSPCLLQISSKNSLQNSWTNSEILSEKAVLAVKESEQEINSLFIDAYDLSSELSPEVTDAQVTLNRADREKDCQRLISYAIGCMMGRYSLDEPGLIYANAGNVGFEPSRYATFSADTDGIVPITDQLWFEDDAPSRIREFLRAVWGLDTLKENMAWLAESLGTKGSETPDETIRRYVADKFFKDHLQTYKKRPIYWLFCSGKQGAFQALVYLHRYSEGTLARLRAEYVIPLTGKIQSRIEMLQKDAVASSNTAARNKLAKEVEELKKKHIELLAYDEQLRHYADMRITLKLDDGVKVNYGKFGNLLAEVKAVTGGASDD
jgi:type II restriction/modification system DNA methylase subunit YeeA